MDIVSKLIIATAVVLMLGVSIYNATADTPAESPATCQELRT